MAKLSKRTTKLGVRLDPGEDIYEIDKENQYILHRQPKHKGFHAPQREHVKQPMPERTKDA